MQRQNIALQKLPDGCGQGTPSWPRRSDCGTTMARQMSGGIAIHSTSGMVAEMLPASPAGQYLDIA